MGQHATIHGYDTSTPEEGKPGRWRPVQIDTTGALVISGSVSGGTVEDTAHSTGDTGSPVMAVRRDVASSGVSDDGDYAMLSVDSTGALRVTGGLDAYELQTAVDTPVSIANASLTEVFSLDVTGWKSATIYFYGPSTALTAFALSFKYKSADTWFTTHSAAGDYADLDDGYLRRLKMSSGTSPVTLPAAGVLMMQVDVEGANLFKLEATQTSGTSNATCKVTLTR